MKELSIEEKAKAYDKALKVLHKYDGANIMFTQDLKEEMFPELKEESEDERIRKELIFYLRYQYSINENFEDIGKWIAWLEKQGEQKPAAWSEEDKNMLEWVIEYLNNRVLNTPISEERTACKNAIAWLEKQGEQILANSAKTCKDAWSEEDEAKLKSILFHIEDVENKDVIDWLKSLKDKVQPQPKKEWGEEDEMFVHGLIRGLAAKRDIHGYITFSSDCIDITETINWLKSLKDRVQPQPRQKWSEEDEKHLKLAIDNFQTLGNSFLTAWLKSLKDRVLPNQEWSEEDEDYINDLIEYFNGAALQHDVFKVVDWLKSLRPQSHWRPSKEQVEILDMVLTNESMDDNIARILRELREQLKKLRGELL